MLNLSKEEKQKRFNLFYAAWLDRWQMTVDIINKQYELIQKRE
jgi:ribonucleotide reductase alpha subunit